MEAWRLFDDDDDDEQHSLSSSLGNDSDVSSSEIECGGDNGDDEPLDTMDSLQQFLPIRRGISKFYDGKSKSYTSLTEAGCSISVKDIAKPENAYTSRSRNRRRTKFMTRNLPPKTNSAITKRTISSCRCRCPSAAALAFSISYDIDSTTSSASHDSSSISPPPNRLSSPSSRMHRSLSAWQSFSLLDIKTSTSSLAKEAAHPSQSTMF